MIKMAREGYVGVTIPDTLIQEIDQVINQGKGGYRSRAEFLKDSARQLLFKIQNNGGEQ